MSELFSHLGVAAVVFVSTNVDDIILLALLFTDPALKPRSVIIGQFLGMGALVLVSAAAGAAALVVPEGYIALLGAAPLIMGLHELWHLRRAPGSHGDGRHDSDEHERSRSARSPRGSHCGLLSVALVTIANGGDNLGVYVPLFARDSSLIAVYSLVFAVMTGIGCLAGYTLVNHGSLGARLARVGRVALPFVLIGLGAWILSGARSLLR